jgi:hypothetical protein
MLDLGKTDAENERRKNEPAVREAAGETVRETSKSFRFHHPVTAGFLKASI